jgi:hypothetical protein
MCIAQQFAISVISGIGLCHIGLINKSTDFPRVDGLDLCVNSRLQCLNHLALKPEIFNGKLH